MTNCLPCPECGKIQLTRTLSDCTLADGFRVKKLPHLKCLNCDARFFDDEAMCAIQAQRGAGKISKRRGKISAQKRPVSHLH